MIFFYFFYFLFSIISNFENALIRFNVRFIFQSNYIFHIMVECIKQILDNSKLYLNVPVNYCHAWCKVGKILKVAWISSPSLKIQIMGGKVYLSCKCKTLLGFVNKLLKTRILLTSPSNVLPYYLNQTFPPIIWIWTEDEGDGIKSRLPFKIFSTLIKSKNDCNRWNFCVFIQMSLCQPFQWVHCILTRTTDTL